MTCILYALYRWKKKRCGRLVQTAMIWQKMRDWKSLGSKRSDQKRNTSSQAFVLFFLGSCRFFINHPVLQDKLVVYTMIRAEPPQLSLLLPLQG